MTGISAPESRSRVAGCIGADGPRRIGRPVRPGDDRAGHDQRGTGAGLVAERVLPRPGKGLRRRAGSARHHRRFPPGHGQCPCRRERCREVDAVQADFRAAAPRCRHPRAARSCGSPFRSAPRPVAGRLDHSAGTGAAAGHAAVAEPADRPGDLRSVRHPAARRHARPGGSDAAQRRARPRSRYADEGARHRAHADGGDPQGDLAQRPDRADGRAVVVAEQPGNRAAVPGHPHAADRRRMHPLHQPPHGGDRGDLRYRLHHARRRAGAPCRDGKHHRGRDHHQHGGPRADRAVSRTQLSLADRPGRAAGRRLPGQGCRSALVVLDTGGRDRRPRRPGRRRALRAAGGVVRPSSGHREAASQRRRARSPRHARDDPAWRWYPRTASCPATMPSSKEKPACPT